MSNIDIKSIYRPLDVSAGLIRVIKFLPSEEGMISLRLMTVSTVSCYYCLSYLCGPDGPDIVKYKILVNTKIFEVKSNLWKFLDMARRKYPTRFFWIDALSINQADDDEKGRVVAGMGKIYSSANQLVVWLGNAELFNLALIAYIRQKGGHAYLRRKGRYVPEGKEFSTHGKKRKWQSLIMEQVSSNDEFWENFKELALQLCQNKYWTRAWILQEIALASPKILLQGNQEVSFWAFEWFLGLKHLDLFDTPAAHIVDAVGLIKGKWHSRPLDTFLRKGTLGNLECEKPRDKVFSILSIAVGGSRIQPDYQQTDEQLFFKIISSLSHLGCFLCCARRLLELFYPTQLAKFCAEQSPLFSAYEPFQSINLNIEEKPFIKFESLRCRDCRDCLEGCAKTNRSRHPDSKRVVISPGYEINISEPEVFCSDCEPVKNCFSDFIPSWCNPENVKAICVQHFLKAVGHFLFIRLTPHDSWYCEAFRFCQGFTLSDERLMAGISLELVESTAYYPREGIMGEITLTPRALLHLLLITWKVPCSSHSSDIFRNWKALS